MTTSVKELVLGKLGLKPEELQLPPVHVDTLLPGEVLKAGGSLPVMGLGLSDGVPVTVVSPTLGVVDHRVPLSKVPNRTSLRDALRQK